MVLKNNKGFTLIEIIVVIAIIAILTGVLAPSLLGNIEKARRQKDTYNAKSIIDILEIAYVDGSISFAENAGDSAVWVYVTKNQAQFFANGGAKFPVINGVSNASAQTEFRNLINQYGVSSDTLKVNAKTAKDGGAAGLDDGWKWYCVYMTSDGKIGVVSGPGEASDNYISNWGNFKNKILGWEDRYKSAMARVVVK